MQWLVPAIVATFFNTVILALIYLYLYRRENEQSLLLFFISWSVYSLRYVFMILHLVVPRSFLLSGIQLSILVSSQLLLIAFNRWLGRKPWPIGWAIGTAIGTIWIIGVGLSDLSFTAYTMPALLYVGVIYVYIGVLIWKKRSRRGPGNRIVAATLILWGFHKMNYPFLRPVLWFAPWGYLLGALAAMITGLGMIVIYFEETRALLKASVREKEILLKEIHHRVKNNLAILHSLIKYQTDSTENSQLQEILQRLEDKVFAFALIHTKLFESPSLDRIDLREYISQLMHHLGESFGLPEKALHVEYATDESYADINTVKSLGLILNELVTNSIKHAFPDGREKMIAVRIERLVHGGHCLVVADNGVGIDEITDASDPKLSGLYLVKLLCEEIEGTFSIRRSAGTEITVEFPRLSLSGTGPGGE